MMRFIFSHLPMALIYGLIIALIHGGAALFDPAYLVTQVEWILGVITGVLLIFLDRVAYVFSFPQEQLSQQFNYLWNARKYISALSLLDARRHEQNKLTFRSMLFMVAWVPVAFFAITSTYSLYGKGVVLGLMLHTLLDSWGIQRRDPAKLNERLFWQISRPVTSQEQIVFLWAITAMFLFMSFWGR